MHQADIGGDVRAAPGALVLKLYWWGGMSRFHGYCAKI